jgi:hypothetical protein
MPKSAAIELNAVNLKSALWDTLQRVKAGKMTPASGDVVASQAREILRTVRTQLSVFSQAGESVSDELVEFAKIGGRANAPANGNAKAKRSRRA